MIAAYAGNSSTVSYIDSIFIREDSELVGWSVPIYVGSVPPPPTYTDTIGGTSNTASNLTGIVFAYQITASNSGTLNSVGLNVFHQSGYVSTAIYTDSSGVPGTLIGQSASSFSLNGWNDLALAGTIVAGHQYWLAFQCNSSGLEPYLSSSSGSVYQYSQAYTYFQTSPSWNAFTKNIANMRMKYS